MDGGPLEFLIKTFRLEGMQECAVNIEDEVSKGIRYANKDMDKTDKLRGLCTKSPNVMVAMRK